MHATPAEAGYDESDGSTGNKHGGFAGMPPKGGPRNRPTAVLDDPKLTFSLTRRAVDFVRARRDDRRPFFLQVSYYAVHEDNQTLSATRAKYARKGRPPGQIEPDVAAMLEDLNTGMVALLDELDRLGLTVSTYVVFASDNGGNHRLYDGDDTSLPLCNHPLRLGKHSLYEGGIRVPFLVRGPGVAAGAVCREPVALYDLLPTFHDLAGGGSSLPATIDGGSLRPLLDHAGRGTVRRTLPGLVFHRPLYGPPLSALRVGDLKLVVNWQTGARELYDLARDLGETRDLSAARPDDTARLFAQLDAYLRAVNAETVADKPDSATGKSRD
jgi:arylsulfatase A-like enzyme